MEMQRQMIHLSGIMFVALAQFTGGLLASLYFFIIAASFLVYSRHVKREQKKFRGFLHEMERRLRGFATRFERPDAARPFLGAFWFYTGSGIAFLSFAMPIASAACAMLAVGDSLSTAFGIKFGRHRIVGSKTLEGSLVFFISSMMVSLIFVGAYTGLIGSLAATAAELIPDAGSIIKIGFVDDNLLIPVLAGLAMLII